MLKNKKRLIILFLALLQYIVWISVTLLVMFPYTKIMSIIAVTIVLVTLGISTALSSVKAKIISFTMLTIEVFYLIWEGIYHNPYWVNAYPAMIVFLIIYYLLLNYYSMKLKEQ